jgi:hypothetical protein
MPYKDENGIAHPMMSDDVTAWASAHIDQCPKCRYVFSKQLIEYTPEEWERYIKAWTDNHKTFTADDCFVFDTSACELCGAKIRWPEQHVEWHNKLGG